MSLSEKTCVPCRGGVKPLTRQEFEPFMQELPSWQVIDDKRLKKTFKTKDFAEALNLANRIGALAEDEGHHPDLTVRWGELTIDLWTHKIDGLSESDFILAAKIDKLED